MPFIYDNLIATAIGTTVILILISIQMRSTNTTVAQMSRNVALNQAETMATWLEEDLESMGRNMGDDDTIYDPIEREENDGSPTDSVLTGLTYYYENESGDKTEIEYDVGDEETRTIAGTDRPIYKLSREQKQKGSVVGGGTSTSLGYFDVRFVDEDAEETTTEDSIQAIRVRFSVVPPFQNDESTLDEVHRMVVVPYTPAQD
jgi:hypothetical protein